MVKPILFDTDILIDVGRGISDAVNFLNNTKAQSSLAVGVVTQMELMIGCQNKSELRTLEKFLKQFQILKINEPISDKAIELLRLYRLSHGLLIGDSLVAATALVLKWPLATKNQKDFRFIKGLTLLPYP